MLDRKGDPEQLSDKRPGRILSTLALQPEVVAKYAPCGFRMICNMIRKEIVTLRTAWNWGARMELVAGRFPYVGLRYPKGDEKPPFQTREEIRRQVAAGGLKSEQIKEL